MRAAIAVVATLALALGFGTLTAVPATADPGDAIVRVNAEVLRGSTAHLGGKTFELRNSADADEPAFEGASCSIEAGATSCDIVVPAAETGKSYVVVETASSAGTWAVQTLATGGATGALTKVAYPGSTGTVNGNAAGDAVVNVPASGTGNAVSIGKVTNAVNNPTFTAVCNAAVNIGLILDMSGSITTGVRSTYAQAIHDLVEQFASQGNITIQTVPFNSSATHNTSLSGAASASLADALYTYITTNGNYANATNWDKALDVAAEISPSVDIAFMITDGAPSQSRAVTAAGNVTIQNLEHAILSANALKQHARIVAVGVSLPGNTEVNLQAISGTTFQSDWYSPSWDELADELAGIADTVACPAFTLAKSASPASGAEVAAGSSIEYTVTADNNGDTLLDPVTISDDLSAVLAHASNPTIVSTQVDGTDVTPATVSGNTLSWQGSLPAGQSVVVKYTVEVDDDASLVTLTNKASASGTPQLPDGDGGTEPSTPITPPDASTTHEVPELPAAVPPTTNAGETNGPQGVPQSWEPTPVQGTADLDWDTLTLLDSDGNPVDEIVVDGEGTYTVVGTEIVFTPEPQFVGEATTVDYRISDEAGLHAVNTYTPTVVEVTPVAVDDSSTGRPNQEQSVNPLLNDEPGDPAVPLDPSSLILLDADGEPTYEVEVPEGVYTLQEGEIVFTPNEDYFGPVTPVEYRVADVNGTTVTAEYQPVIEVDPPTTDDGETTGIQGAQQSWTPTPVAGQDFPIVDGSLTLLDEDGNPTTSITVDGVGTYAVVGTEIVFTPEPQFVGEAPAVDYRVTDEGGQHAEGTYTPTVTAVTPTAVNDSSVGRANEPQSVDPLANDVPGDLSVPLDPSSLTLLDADGNPADEVTVPEGVYTIDVTDPATPLIVFTPNENYFGTPTPVEYQVADANGTTAAAEYQPEVVVDPPATNDGETTGPQGVPQSWEPTPVAGEDFDIDWSTLTLLDSDGNPVDEIVVDGEGTYTVVGKQIVFTPEPQFVGTATTVDYRISDEGGQHAEATYTPTVTPVAPVANDDTTTGRPNQPQSVDPLANDEPGHEDVPLDPSSLTLLDPVTGDPVGEVEVPEGVYTVEEGKIVFTPKPDYFGPVTPVEYRVADVNGTTDTAKYQPVIEVDQPTTDNGESTGPQGVPQSWTPSPTAGQDFPIVADSLTLLDADGNPTDEIVVDGVGTYTVASGAIVFTPVPAFVGKAPTVDYRVTDAGGQHAEGTYTPTVTAVKPVANDDASSGWWNTPQSVDPLANDEAGDPAVPLDPSSLTLLDADGDPADEVTVPEGVYTIDRTNPAQPRIVFTPNRDYTGTPTPVDYRISDVNGTPAEAIYQPSVRGPEDSQDLAQTKVCGSTVTFDTVSEVPGLDAGSVRLRDANGSSVLELVVDGEGTWKVDPATGRVTFTPVGCLDEDPTPVNWEGTLTDGTPIVGTLSVFYTEPEDTASEDDDEELAYTGVNPLLPAGLAGLLLTAGLVLVGIRRRGGLIS